MPVRTPPSGGASRPSDAQYEAEGSTEAEGASAVPSCPQCGAAVPDCDFCEGCGFWLKVGECRFCYAPVPDGASFCPECGCEQAGILCSGCGTRNHFDFCSGCGQALTEAAEKSLAEIAADPALAVALAQLRAAPAPVTEAPQVAAPELASPARPSPRRSLFSDSERRVFRDLNAAADRGQSDREAEVARERENDAQARAELEHRRQREEQIRLRQQESSQKDSELKRLVDFEALEKLARAAEQRTFADQQAARRYFMALRASFAVGGRTPKGWRCNRYCVVHGDPNECSAPQLGGQWIMA